MADTPFSEPFELAIDSIVTGGAGLGRLDGRVIFVPGTCPGERVRAKAVKVKKSFVQARLEEVLEPSPQRVEPPLGEIGNLSGCDLQHLDLAAQRAAKRAIVLDCLKRQGGVEADDLVDGPVTDAPGLGYRNKVRLHRAPTGQWGVIRAGSHDVLPIERHGLMPDLFNDVVLPWLAMLPPLEQAVVRLDTDGGWLAALFGPPTRLKPLKAVLGGDDVEPAPGCRGVLYNNFPVWGRDHLLMRLGDRTWRVHARSFFQVNFRETEAAVALAASWLDDAGITAQNPAPVLVDLYGGVGLFGLALGDRAEKIIGVEDSRQAVVDARNNYDRDARTGGRATVLESPVDKATKAWKFNGDLDFSQALVICDPPREGLGEHVTNDLSVLKPPRILMMSCDPATLARDVKALGAAGYRLTRGRVIDMFPMTSHVESLVELVRD
ncbi:MAG TPA: hypothetical protein P5571_09100 [Candidatus Krumholzibacteria bacterium]|nr:hypothetical protein [Candidatus Krumholzibacteria bacterium]HRX51506.1 hypothetical protein [Candidatus Krumholzibacteria bacterium]